MKHLESDLELQSEGFIQHITCVYMHLSNRIFSNIDVLELFYKSSLKQFLCMYHAIHQKTPRDCYWQPLTEKYIKQKNVYVIVRNKSECHLTEMNSQVAMKKTIRMPD